MTNSNGWTQEEWKQFHELKTKANIFNLEEATKILRKEVVIRAERQVLVYYLESEEV